MDSWIFAQHGYRCFVARRQVGDQVEHLDGVGDWLAVDGDQNVARPDAGLVGRAAAQHAGDDARRDFLPRPKRFGQLGRDVLRLDADPAAHDLAGADDRLHHRLRGRDRNRKADAERAAAARIDRGIDAEQVAVGVDQRAARIAGIDRGVGLDEVLEGVDAEVVAAERRDDAHGDGLADAERVADRQHDVADLRLFGVAERDRRQVLAGRS